MQGTDWQARWARLAAAVGLGPSEPVLVALSGGADSVLLALLVSRARPRPRALCVHVDHGLRGAESEEDAAFCARLCRRLELPLVRRRAPLGARVLEAGSTSLDEAPAEHSDLEARARRARYAVLVEEAARAKVSAIATGHHADDALETLLLRWMRGTHLEGLAGLRASSLRRPAPARSAAVEPGESGERGHFGERGEPHERGEPVRILRPLLGLRRAEVRALLRAEGVAWREDSSNHTPRFARNRVRNLLLPSLRELGGADVERGLFAFAHAVERLEDALAERTATLGWRPFEHAAAARDASRAHLGGTLPRGALRELAPALVRRALWRLLTEGTGRGPSREHLERIQADLEHGRCRRHALAGGWTLALRGAELALMPPSASDPRARRTQPALPFAQAAALEREPSWDARRLEVPGSLRLGDGRAIAASWIEAPAGRPPPRSSVEVELDAGDLSGPLSVRAPRPGDRFHGLGAPGSRPLARVLADAGVPREERARVPLVLAGSEIVWIAGLRPCEARRVRPGSTRRLALSLVGAAPTPALRRRAPALPSPVLFGAAPP